MCAHPSQKQSVGSCLSLSLRPESRAHASPAMGQTQCCRGLHAQVDGNLLLHWTAPSLAIVLYLAGRFRSGRGCGRQAKRSVRRLWGDASIVCVWCLLLAKRLARA